jgi:hypothetical protein
VFQTLANTVLVLHVGVVLFVVGGLVLVLLGNCLGWHWVNLLWFRLLHIATILYVAGQAWFGITCPLTTLENYLRNEGGSAGYASSFIEHWFQRVLFYDAPPWVFTLAYTAFALAVAASWFRFPPVSVKLTSHGRKRGTLEA